MLDIMQSVEAWLADDENIAIATVTRTWGSAPRREGSKLAVKTDLAMTGSVSGGCIEGAVIEEALDSLKKNTPHLLSFGVADDTAWEVGLTCGGRINVFVEGLDKEWWSLVKERSGNNLSTTTITVLDGDLVGEKALFDGQNNILYQTVQLKEKHITAFVEIAKTTHRSGQITWESTELMVDVLNPRPHLIIIGGVHIAIPLQSIANLMGFRVSIIDPRRAFATDERFPEVDTISHEYPTKALAKLGLDKDTYLAVLTHDPKIDDQALTTTLPAGLPYIGVLSSRKTHEKRRSRLLEAGISDELIQQIQTPIGVDLGGRTPEEIALGIMAEIIAVRNGVREELTR